MRSLALLQKKTRLALMASALVLGLASSAAAYFYVYPPYVPPSGRAYKTLAADWWKFVLKQPESSNPLLGANCNNGQSGQFFFLTGTADNTPTVRNCTVPVGKTIVFPVINAIAAAFPDDPANEKTVAFQRAVIDGVKNATGLSVKIDGTVVPNVKSWLEESDPFEVSLPANNIYGLPTGTLLKPAVDKGFYLALTPFNPGPHTIEFKATYQDTTVDVKYNITQKATP